MFSRSLFSLLFLDCILGQGLKLEHYDLTLISMSVLWKWHTCVCITVLTLLSLQQHITIHCHTRALIWPHVFLMKTFSCQFQHVMNSFLKPATTTSLSLWLSFHKLIVFLIPNLLSQEKDHYLLNVHLHIKFSPPAELCSQW